MSSLLLAPYWNEEVMAAQRSNLYKKHEKCGNKKENVHTEYVISCASIEVFLYAKSRKSYVEGKIIN